MRKLVLIAHNLRSTHNVGSLLRTADGLGVNAVYLTGYTPYPTSPNDSRLPHLARKIDAQIHKTALGAENSITWRQADDIQAVLNKLSGQGYEVAALEQDPVSTPLPDYRPPAKLAIVVGREAEGLESEVLAACQQIIEIPMLGSKESYNVVQAAAMALYHCRFTPVT